MIYFKKIKGKLKTNIKLRKRNKEKTKSTKKNKKVKEKRYEEGASDLFNSSYKCNYKFTSYSLITTQLSSFYNLSGLIITTRNHMFLFSTLWKNSIRGFQSAVNIDTVFSLKK